MKKIGIVAQQHGESYGVHEDLIRFASLFGAPVALLPQKYEDMMKTYSLDAIIMPGGADVDHMRYSSTFSYDNGPTNRALEYFDNVTLRGLIGNIPLFGICRGLQSLNVMFGGTLKQDIPWHPYSAHNTQEVHGVFEPGTNHGKNAKPLFSVNSFHHQAIDRIGAGIEVELVANDGIIEAISVKKLKIFAVQWHPERIFDDYSIEKLNELLK